MTRKQSIRYAATGRVKPDHKPAGFRANRRAMRAAARAALKESR